MYAVTKQAGRVAAAVALATGLVLSGGFSVAHADPTGGAFRTYKTVGSDTIQDVWNGLSNGVSGINSGNAVIANVASYDAFGSTNITTYSGGPSFARPAGSGNGIKALSAAWDSSNHVWSGTTLSSADVSFSRSSSPASGTGTELTYIPFARDAVSVAYNPTSTETTVNFTTGELTSIYSGVDAAGDNITFTGGYPYYNGHRLYPVVPQSGSGTRSFFLSAIGVSSLASYVEPTASTIPENNGSYVDGTNAGQDGSLIPFSAGQWIAQKNGVTTDTTGSLLLASINGSAPTSGSGSSLAPGALYGSKTLSGLYNSAPVAGLGVFNRDTYNVLPTSVYSPSGANYDATLVGTLTTDLETANAKAVIAKYGFGNLSYRDTQTRGWSH